MNLFILLFLFGRSVSVSSIIFALIRSFSLPLHFILFIFPSQNSFSLSRTKIQLCEFLLSLFLLKFLSDVGGNNLIPQFLDASCLGALGRFNCCVLINSKAGDLES